MITLTNTVTGKKEKLTTLKDGSINLYACGITPYDYAHLGHGRCYIIFDVLVRFLKLNNYSVNYCRNFTDIDDKLIARAEKELGDPLKYKEVADKYISYYLEDMEALNCQFPQNQPRVTEVIPEIISLIERLVAKGNAYSVDGDVYYEVKSFPAYGALSKRSLEDLHAGSRIEINQKKKNPLDFALWKHEKAGFWDSPWGHGRPGWHIECSAMAMKYFGDSMDIHAGGQDLIFPHHENEIAQSEGATGKPFVHHWMHVAFVRINQEKMSKSLGNFFTLRDLFNLFDPMVIRFYILNHHYRSPLDFALSDLESSEKAYRKLCKAFSVRACLVNLSGHDGATPLLDSIKKFVADDLNTVGLWGVVFENLDTLGDEFCLIKSFIQNVLGLTLENLPQKIVCITPEIQKLLNARDQARTAKDWTESDRLRDQLKELGVEVQDRKL